MSQTPPPQPPYGPPNQYGAPGFGPMVPDHPQAMLVLVLGAVSVFACPVLGPFAWVIGGRVVREIDASNGQVGGRSTANAGRILGIVMTAIMGLALVIVVLALIVVLIGAAA